MREWLIEKLGCVPRETFLTEQAEAQRANASLRKAQEALSSEKSRHDRTSQEFQEFQIQQQSKHEELAAEFKEFVIAVVNANLLKNKGETHLLNKLTRYPEKHANRIRKTHDALRKNKML